MRVIAVQAANLLMNSTDRTYLDTEFQLLVDEIDCVGCTGLLGDETPSLAGGTPANALAAVETVDTVWQSIASTDTRERAVEKTYEAVRLLLGSGTTYDDTCDLDCEILNLRSGFELADHRRFTANDVRELVATYDKESLERGVCWYRNETSDQAVRGTVLRKYGFYRSDGEGEDIGYVRVLRKPGTRANHIWVWCPNYGARRLEISDTRPPRGVEKEHAATFGEQTAAQYSQVTAEWSGRALPQSAQRSSRRSP